MDNGFSVELWNGETKFGGDTVYRTSGNDGTVIIENVPVFDANGDYITYTVKEGAPDTWADGLKDEFDPVPGEQSVKLEPGKTVSVDTDGNTLYVNNRTRVKITAEKDKRNTWQHGHGGFDFPLAGATIGLYRRLKAEEGQTPAEWSFVMSARTDTEGKVSFDKLPRIDENGKDYEYALVELASGDSQYFPVINGVIKDDGYPANTTDTLADADLFGTSAKYNALPVPALGTAVEYNLTPPMINANHWVQFHVKKWLDGHDLDYNIENHIGDSDGHRKYPTDEDKNRAPGADGTGDTPLSDCVYSLYRYILNEGQTSVAFDRATWQLVGTYTSGQLLDNNTNPIAGEFLTDPDLGITNRYVYVLVEDNVGPNSVIPNPYYKYTFWHYPGVTVSCTAEGSTVVRNFAYDIDDTTHTDVLNSWKKGEGDGNILLASFRLAKWRDSYNAQGQPEQNYEPLYNAVFELRLPNGDVIATMTSGLDLDPLYAFAQSGTYQLQIDKVEGSDQYTYTMVEYEVPSQAGQLDGKSYDVTNYVMELADSTHPGWKIYGVKTELVETSAPAGYGFRVQGYPTYLIFVDKDPGGTSGKYRFYSDLYLVKSKTNDDGISLAEDQDPMVRMWHATDADATGQIYISLGSGDDLQRLVNYPMTNTPVEVIKVGYNPQAITNLPLTSEAIAQRTDSEELEGVQMTLYVKKGDNFEPFKYDGTNSTFTTDVNGSFRFLDGLPMGTYRIVENSLGTLHPEYSKYEMAYDDLNTHYREFVVGGKPVLVYMANPEKIDLVIRKTDMTGTNPLTGWTFSLGGIPATTVQTDPGTYYFNDLPSGHYTLTEDVAGTSEYTKEYFEQWFVENHSDLADLVGSGMDLGNSYQTQELTSDDNAVLGTDWVVSAVKTLNGALEVTVRNPKKVAIELLKVRDGTTTPLSGARFRVRQLDFSKTTGDLEIIRPAAAATVTATDTNFSAWKPVKNGNNDYWQTDTNGKISLTGLKPGVYAIYEYQAPTGYEPLTDDDGNLVVYTAVVTGGLPVTVTVKLADGTTAPNVSFDPAKVSITAPNVPKSTIQATKVVDAGALNNSEIGDWSVTLNVYAAETGGTPLASATISKTGNQITAQPVTFKKGSTTVYFSHNTKYWLEEVVTKPTRSEAETQQGFTNPPFILASYQIGDATITLGENETRAPFYVGTDDVVSITANNQYLYGKILLQKYDENKVNTLPKAEFVIQHKVNDVWTTFSENTFTFDEYSNGRYRLIFPLDRKEATEYRVLETKAPEGYVLEPNEEDRSIIVSLKWDDNATTPQERGNVKDVTANPDSPLYDESLFLTNTQGNPLEIEKLGYDKNAASFKQEVKAGDVKFKLYHYVRDTEHPDGAWIEIAEATSDDNGKVAFGIDKLLVPHDTYAIAESYANPDKFIRPIPSGVYASDDDVNPMPLQDTEVINAAGTTENVKAVRFRNDHYTGTITFKAYNTPYIKPIIRKLDVGQYPNMSTVEGQEIGPHAAMKFKVIELPTDYALAAEGAERDAQIAELAKITNTTVPEGEAPAPRIVFQGDTNSQAAEIDPSPTYEGATVNGTQVTWQESAAENRWDHTKRYILVETEVSATDSTDYDTMVKSDARVHWYTVIDPIADPAEAPTFTLTNINAVANVELTKSVVYQSDDPTGYSQVYKKSGEPTVASLITGARQVVYTLAPDVTGKNQMLKSFFLKETGLAALTAEEYGSADVPAVPDYQIEKIVIGQASHKVPANLSGAPIFAQVTFHGTYGDDVRPAIQLQDATTAQLTLTPNPGTKTFEIEYFSTVISNNTDGLYKLGEEFRVQPTTVYMKLSKISDDPGPAIAIDKFKNTSEAELAYPRWSATGEGPTDTTITAPAKEIVNVDTFEIPIVDIQKHSDKSSASGNEAVTGAPIKYTITISNTSRSNVPFVNPIVLDILPTGVTFYNPGLSDYNPRLNEGSPLTLKTPTVIVGRAVQGQVTGEDGTVYHDAETCVLFEMTGSLAPGESTDIIFYASISPSALLYDQLSSPVQIHNDAYLSSAASTPRTPENPHGYPFAVNKTENGYKFGWTNPDGDDISTAAGPDTTVCGVHESGVHEELKGNEHQPDYTDVNNYIWVKAEDEVPVVAGSELTLYKQVKGDQDTYFHGNPELGVSTRTVNVVTPTHNIKQGYVDWLLIVDSGNNVAKNLIVSDVIPKVGDGLRQSKWDNIFDSFSSVVINGEATNKYKVWYYVAQRGSYIPEGQPNAGAYVADPAEIAEVIAQVQVSNTSATKEARNWTGDTHDNWKTDITGVDKAKILAFIMVFDEDVQIEKHKALSITYHALVSQYNDDGDFSENRAFKNATNDFYTYYSGYSLVQKSGPVSVTLMDQKVEIEGDVWIDEDWDATQEHDGNRRDYSQYAIIQELVGDGMSTSPTDPGKISFSIKDERFSAGNTVYEAPRRPNTSIGESIRHFVFEELGAAAAMEGYTLYIPPENYLNAGKHIPDGDQYGALKGTDPFHYTLYSEINATGSAIMDVFSLTDRGSGHYMSDNPDQVDSDAQVTSNALDSNFAENGSNVDFMTFPFYIRYSQKNDESKDIGFRMTRGLEITKLAADNSEPIKGIKFKAYGPFNDSSDENRLKETHSAADRDASTLMYFVLTDGVYQAVPMGTDGAVTELVTGEDGKIVVTGLNWWKEYDFVETEAPAEYSISGAVATADNSVNTRILDHEDGSFTLLIPDKAKTSAQKTDKVTVTNPRGLDFKFRKLSAEVTVNGEGVDVITTPSPLEGAIFGLFTDEACTTPFTRGGQDVTATSGSDGYVTFTLLPYGTYYMKETGGISGYWLNTSVYEVKVLPKTNSSPAHVEVKLISGSGSETKPDVYGRTGILQQVTNDAGQVLYQYEIVNLKVKVKAKLVKVDEFDQEKKLANAQFGLFADADCTGTPLMTVTTDANGEASFGWLVPGTYYMKETVPPTGYPLSDTVYELTITYSSTNNTVSVTFNGAAVTLEQGKATFKVTITNTPTPATLQIPVKKVLDGEQPAQGVTLSFDFELTPQDGAPMPKNSEGQPKDKDTVTVTWPTPNTGKFAEIEFKQAGEYKYTVKEVIPESPDPHVAYHRTPYTVTVTVAYGTGNDAGKLFATYASEPPADADGNLVFTNTYTPDPVKLKIPVKKVLDENIATAPTAESLANASFTFTIEAHSDTPNAPLPTSATVDVKPNETKYFDVIKYTKAGVYKYTVTEMAGSNPHYTPLDPTTWNITVTVEDTADKKLKVTGYVITDGTTTVTATSDQLPHSDLPENLCTPTTPELAVVFTNPYTPDPVKLVIPVKKEIRNTTGTAPDNDATFTFTIAADESTPNAPLPNPTTTTVIGATTGAFGEIEYTKAGTYKYTVTETACDNTHYDPLDPTIWNIEVTVTNTEADVLKVTGYVITDGTTTVTATSAQLPHSDPPENLCTPTTSELAVVFKNPYTPEPVKLVIPVEKEVTLTTESGTAPVTIPNFKFTIAADDGTPMPKDGYTVSVIVDPATRKGSGSFSEITYTAAGEYTYTVIEEKEDVTYPAYTYDQTEWEVYVKVENKGDTLMVTQYRTTKISKDPNVADVVTWAASGELEHVTVGEGKDRYKLCTPKTPKLAVGFDNPYTPAPVRLVIPVEKKITYTTGTAPVSNAKFTFTIAADESTPNAPLPNPTTTTVIGATTRAFSEITYTKAGTYKYTVTETACDNTHYNPLDPTTWSIEVTVENTADDILKVTSYKVNGTEAADQLTHKTIGEGKNRYNLCTVPEALAVVFTNPYTPDPVKLKIPVEKKINNTTGTAPVSNAQFTFTIAADETTPDAPLPKDASGTVKDTVVITGADTGVFDEIEYTKAGVYKYTVTETACDNTHYDPLDSTTWNIEVTVTNTEADVLKVTGYVITDGKTTVTATSAQLPHSDLPENLCTPTTPELAVVFENPYTPDPVKLVIPVEKKIPTETAPVTDETFTFTITAADGTPLPNPATVTITGAGTGTFGQIEYTKADTYTYTVKEIKPENSNDHYTYSEEEWTVVVTVENTADDVLKVTGYETKAKNSGETKTATSADLPHSAMPENVCTVAEALGAIIFDNPYTPDPVKLVIPVEKKIPTDSAPVTGETFTFTIEAADGAPLPNPATTTVTGEGTGAFGQIEYTKAGTYTYTVKETRGSNKHYEYSTEEWTVKVTVENTADDVLKVTGYETKAKNSGETKTATSADLPHSAMPENVCTVAEALGAIIFNNPYTPDPVKLTIEVEKNFRSYTSTKLPDTTFYFDLKAKGNAPLPNPQRSR